MELEEKLKNLAQFNLMRGKDVAPPKVKPRMVEELDGKLMKNQYGEFVLVRKDFDPRQLHPHIQLSFPINFHGKSLSLICTSKKSIIGKTDPLPFNLQETIFIDCETTGLAGGAGTYAFLVGLGFFFDDEFRVEQYFMQDFHQERAVLSGITKRLNEFKFLVSFNGKCYDLPLLESRFLINRLDFDSSRWMHFDLLFPSRRLWKRRIGDCSLGNLEQQILSIKRDRDVPSFMIPQIYFDYLRTGETEPLIPVFHHNVHDILSLLILSFLIDQVLEDFTPAGINDPIDLYSLGRIHYHFGNYQQSERCYQQALAEKLPSDWRFTIYLNLALLYKRTGLWDKAKEVWHQLMEEDFPFYPMVYEELAKYYEHRRKDFQQALSLVENVLTHLHSGRFYEDDSISQRRSSVSAERLSWQYRKERLLRKMERTRIRQNVDSS